MEKRERAARAMMPERRLPGARSGLEKSTEKKHQK